MAQRELGQPLRADGVACLSSFTTAWRAPRGSGSPSHRRQRATGSDATVPVPTGGASLAARTFEMNDERAVSQARPTYPGGRGDLPESPKSPRPYSEITGRQGCRPFDARQLRARSTHAGLPNGHSDDRTNARDACVASGRRQKLPHKHHQQAAGPVPTARCPEERRQT